MRYIEALDEYSPEKDEKSIFFAGGITNCPNWQQDLVKLLENTDLIIYNPRRKNFPIHDPNASLIQIKWEHKYFRKATMISFWFSRGSLNPIVLFELGKWLVQYKKIFIGIDPEYERKRDVEIQVALENTEINIVYSIDNLAQQIIKEVLK